MKLTTIPESVLRFSNLDNSTFSDREQRVGFSQRASSMRMGSILESSIFVLFTKGHLPMVSRI